MLVLPFLNKKQGMVSGLIIKNRKADKPEENQEDSPGLEAAMEELHNHLAAKDFKAAAECFKNAFQLCEKQPHEEGEHINPNSYDAQNQEAGEKR